MADDNFADMLAAYGAPERVRLAVGDRVRAKVIHISDSTVFCELSRSQEASLPRSAVTDADGRLMVQVGDSIDAFVTRLDETVELGRQIGRDRIDLPLLESARASGLPLEGKVTGVNKGGIEVSIGGARGFCPMGQVDTGFVQEPQALVGKTLEFVVREVRDGGRSVLVSRRALLERRRQEQAETTLAALAEGQEITGKVTRLAAFGAFVDIGGIDGLIAMSELSHARVAEAGDVVAEGETVTVKVLRIEDDPKRPGERRIALSLKAVAPDPFVHFRATHAEGDAVSGVVRKLESYGAFIELEPGVEGLAHVSELADKRIGHPREVLKVGQQVLARVTSLDAERRRIGLSLKEVRASAGDAPLAEGLGVGALVEGTVERIERYGVFVALPGGAKALLPAAETGTPRGSDLGKLLPVGTTLALKVIGADDRGRLKVSKKARDEHEERADLQAYMARADNAGFGTTFGELLKKKK